jgi:hypothetical protein
MAIRLGIYGRADAPSALDPVANDLVAVERGQDKQNGKASQSDPGGKLILTLASNHIAILQCCENTSASWLPEHPANAHSYRYFGGKF